MIAANPHRDQRGRIILLNGASSSGKTSIAKQLQALPQAEAFLHVSLDAFRTFEPPGYWTSTVEPFLSKRIEGLCRSMNAAAAAYARAGDSVIVDHVLPDQAWAWIEADWAGLQVLMIGVHCDQVELSRRERTREDRPIGLAASQFHAIHRGRAYDFEIDSTCMNTEDCVALLNAWLKTRPERDRPEADACPTCRPNCSSA